MMGARRWLLAATVLGAIGCGADHATGPPRPGISDVIAAPNAYNALSIVVSVRATGGDSAHVLYADGSGPERATPYLRVRRDTAHLVALGLAPSTAYSVRVEVRGLAGADTSAPIAVTTGSLPDVLRGLHLEVSGTPSPGYTLLTPVVFGDPSNGYVLAFDSSGTLAWYREFDGDGWTVEAKQQGNGDITVYVGASYGFQPSAGRYVEVRPNGEQARTFQVEPPSYTDPHELLLTFRDSMLVAAHLLGYDVRQVDLSALGGSAQSLLAEHFIERQTTSGGREFQWFGADHYTASDWPVFDPNQPDLDHPSALALALDGNYVVSFQALDEVAKIDALTGAFVWRLGGRHNQFTFLDDPEGGFQGQHCVRVLDDGHVLLLDNRLRSTPPAARAVEYALDTLTMTARLVWEYRPNPLVVSPVMGSVQRLANGNTVVGFAIPGRVDEVDPSGHLVAQARLLTGDGVPVEFYRALRVPSLYRYQRP